MTTPTYPPPMNPEGRTNWPLIAGGVLAVALVVIGAAFLLSRPDLTPTPSPTAVAAASVSPNASASASAPATATPTATASASAAATPTAEPTPPPSAEATPTPTPSAAPTATPAVTPTPTAEATPTPQATPTAEATPTPTPGALPSFGPPDQGIAFTTPVLLGDPASGLAVVGALVQNTNATVDSYTTIAEFHEGESVTATANGFGNDHRPGEIRPIQLQITEGEPVATDPLTIGIDTMVSQDESTPNADLAALVTFGTPTVTPGDPAEVDVDVTNGSDTPATLTIICAALREGALVGIGTVDISLTSGQTDAAQIFVTGTAETTDQIICAVDTVTI